MVMSLINEKIVHSLRNSGINALGINGVSIINAKRKDKLIILNEKNRKMVIDGGYTGKITSVNSDIIKNIVLSGYIPVISPVAYSPESYLNIDADRAAAYIAGYTGASTLIMATNVDGLYWDGTVVEDADSEYIKSIITSVGHGMDKKLMAATEAIDLGVQNVIISNPFKDIMHGTVISRKTHAMKI